MVNFAEAHYAEVASKISEYRTKGCSVDAAAVAFGLTYIAVALVGVGSIFNDFNKTMERIATSQENQNRRNHVR